MKRTTPEQRAEWLEQLGDLNENNVAELLVGGVIRALILDIEELEAKLAEYEATATLDPVVECPSCGLEISLTKEGGAP
jgi:hypothetical protein